MDFFKDGNFSIFNCFFYLCSEAFKFPSFIINLTSLIDMNENKQKNDTFVLSFYTRWLTLVDWENARESCDDVADAACDCIEQINHRTDADQKLGFQSVWIRVLFVVGLTD